MGSKSARHLLLSVMIRGSNVPLGLPWTTAPVPSVGCGGRARRVASNTVWPPEQQGHQIVTKALGRCEPAGAARRRPARP